MPQVLDFNFKDHYAMENQRVKLVPLNVEHIEPLTKISNDPVIWRYLLEDGAAPEALKQYVMEALEERRYAKSYPFAVYDKHTQCYAGTTRLYEVNPVFRHLKVGHTWYGKAFRGTGINAACKKLLFHFVFEQLNFVRIGFGVHGDNVPSLRALRKMGIQQEGQLRDFFPGSGEKDRVDLVLLSLLKKEFTVPCPHFKWIPA